MTEMRDWNVSRQLWWGHRIPAWYCPDGHTSVTADAAGPSACEVCARPAAELRQDDDIFDTWFSSGLWPFSTLGWPERTRDFERFYPGSVMETAYDIIFFWVARMMMLGIHLTGEAPFHTVYLSGLIRDPYGQKMSKTKGNVVDPLEAIDESGADALRFALVHGAAPGNDQRFSAEKLENARNFTNKLWNATRWLIGARPASIAPDAPRRAPDATRLGPGERWLASRIATTVAEVDRALADFGFADATRLLYDATWNDYCDWAIELAKVRLADATLPEADREATWWSMVAGLDTLVRLLHPVIPFVTEAIWQHLPHAADDPELLIVARWPEPGGIDAAAEAPVAAAIELVRAIRNARGEARIEPAAWLPVHVVAGEDLAPAFDELRPALERLARARPLERHVAGDALDGARVPGSLAVIAGLTEAVVQPAAEDADRADRERGRLERELQEAESLLGGARARLANPSFVERAPAAVVDGARAREAELADLVARLRERLGD
jgi:valyl-tRNA synthetase